MRMGIMIGVVSGMLALTGCGKKTGGSNPADAYLSHLDGIAAAIETAKDEASARRAAETIADINRDMAAVTESLKSMSEQDKAAALTARMEEYQRVQMRISNAMQALAAQPQLMRIINDEMRNMPGVK